MTATRAPVRLRPLASAMRITPLLVAAIPGTAAAATIKVNDPGAFASAGSCTIVDAVDSLNAAALQAACNNISVNSFGLNDTVDLSLFQNPTEIVFSNIGGSSALTLLVPATISGTLQASGAPMVTIERANASPEFRLIESSSSLTVQNVALTGGSAAAGSGGAIYVLSNGTSLLTLTGAVVQGNIAAADGGGIASTSNVTMINSLVTGNTAGNHGGGVALVGTTGSLLVTDSIVSDNIAAYGGGVSGKTVNVIQSTIIGNSASKQGGGIYGAGPTQNIVVIDSTISGNNAQNGGGIYALHAFVYRTTINANSAQGRGGGFSGNLLTLSDATISGNSAQNYGAGVALTTPSTSANNMASMQFTTITDNTLTGPGARGAGIFVSSSSPSLGNVVSNLNFLMSAGLAFGNVGGSDVGGGKFSTLQVSGSNDLIGTVDAGTLVPAGTSNCNPQLGFLNYYGGPTKTHPLSNASCAINAGPSSTSIGTDQRGSGFVRNAPVNGATGTDIGAFEYQPTGIIYIGRFEL
jgi:hypothetical protein